MTNRLAHETSPYLLQHSENPVDWYPWGEEALVRSKREEKPIFLSIGYSACHWCHVMERESFEDHEIAGILNDHFVCIKVDREERPDLDQIYMQAVQILTGRGGWPMSVFLTPDLQPIFGGTYWPPRAKMNMPGFDRVLHAVLDAWQNRRQQAVAQAKQLAEHIAAGATPGGEHELSSDMLPQAAELLRQQFDHTHGGFGMAPKFPQPMNLQLLLRVWSRQPSQEWVAMVRLNLDKMASGGIYDHLAGGFARYSVDERWLVPHFEKMLYDNALLVDAYLDGYLITRDEHYAEVARETLDYVLNYMTDDSGAFHSAEDADSEGEEGKFYVWTPDEVREILGPELGERFCDLYDVTEAGNFEAKSILNLPKTLQERARIKSWDAEHLRAEMLEARQRLLEVRDRRVRPTKDDKILVSWNGLMIHSMARAGGVLGDDKYVISATRAADFILKNMRRADGRLLHAWRAGGAKFDAYLDDYACLANALVTLYEASFEERWIDHAVALMETVLRHFADPTKGGFFFTADDHEQLIARTKDFQDNASPSGNAMAATVLLRLGKLCGRTDFVEAAEGTLRMAAGLMQEHPIAAGQMLLALDTFLGPTHEIVVLGDGADTQAVIQELRRHYHSTCVLACRRGEARDTLSPHLSALFEGKTLQGEAPALYVCQDFTCQEPVHGKAAALLRVAELVDAKGGDQ